MPLEIKDCRPFAAMFKEQFTAEQVKQHFNAEKVVYCGRPFTASTEYYYAVYAGNMVTIPTVGLQAGLYPTISGLTNMLSTTVDGSFTIPVEWIDLYQEE